MTARRTLTALAVAAMCAALPASAFGQASASNGSAATEYGDYVPTASGGSTTPKPSSSHRSPRRTRHSAPTHRYVPPVRHYTAPARPVAPRAVIRSTPVVTPSRPAAAPHRRHRARGHHPHHAAAVHRVAKATPGVSKPHVSVPAAPAASVDGGSRQLVLLGLAMLAMTVAVFAHAGWRRRHGSA